MRRALAAAVLGISLWIGTLAWSGFVLLRTVLDPERSREVAEALYDDEAVRAQLAENIAGGITGALPPGSPVPPGAVEETAAAALDDPAVEALFVDALARTHAAFLGEGRPPQSVDPGAVGSAARGAVVARHPDLDAVLPPSPQLAVPLPTEQVPNLGPVRDALQAAVPLLALASAAGALLALLVTSNRPAVVRRAGVWAIGLSATVLLLAYGVPYLAEALLPGQAAVITALVRAMAETTRGPALALAGTGLGAVVVAAVWRRAPAPDLASEPPRRRRHRRPPPPVAGPRRDLPRPARRPAPVRSAVPRTRLPDGYAPGARRAEPAPSPRTRVGRGAAPTVVQPSAPPAGPPPPAAARAEPGSIDATAVDGAPARRTRWVEGVGWVLESSEAIPPEARWVPGVGYVVDER